MFSGLTDAQLAQISDALTTEDVPAGTNVIEQGQDDFEAMKFYLVEEGEFETTIKDEGGEEVVVKKLEAGDYFGEKALLEKVARAATVTAKSDGCKMAWMEAAAFERLMGEKKDWMADQVKKYKSVKDVQAEEADGKSSAA